MAGYDGCPDSGSSTAERALENSKIVEVSDEDLDQVDAILTDFRTSLQLVGVILLFSRSTPSLAVLLTIGDR